MRAQQSSIYVPGLPSRQVKTRIASDLILSVPYGYLAKSSNSSYIMPLCDFDSASARAKNHKIYRKQGEGQNGTEAMAECEALVWSGVALPAVFAHRP